MYAIVEIAGKQYKAEKDAVINVDRMKEDAGKELVLDRVLLYADGGTVKIGQPYLDSVKIKAEVLGEIKGKKVRGIKFKKRKNYTRTLGHRPVYSQLKVKDLVLS
ncbi:MAG TPA: 50S ribosomal protein L21 [Spirochaetota bacterium]|mgnify:CR=1 FL=1|nr:50S ribosomal protein L21 [Spirochaetota bacterium]HPI89485.1 50S ribosomal protein L21 [Spirochaetota bacterium]HPR49342.1 50S ribosomal protein L21 [Spirochaetota bacterium]